jgi:hypothetical protein
MVSYKLNSKGGKLSLGGGCHLSKIAEGGFDFMKKKKLMRKKIELEVL